MLKQRGLTEGDALDADTRELLAMADGAVVTFAATILEGDDLIGLVLLEDLADHRRAADERAAVGELVAVRVHEDLGESGFRTRFQVQFVHVNDVAFGHSELFAAGFEDRVCHKTCFAPMKREADSMPVKSAWQGGNLAAS